MAQHDYVINNDTAPNVRSDINLALAAIASNNSGATEPATTYANMFWYDTDTDVMKQRNENNSAWVTLELTPTTPVSLTQAQAEDDASTVFGTVSGQRLAQATATPYGTLVNTTSGTAFDFTGIPAGVSEITLTLNAVSLTGTDRILVQIGPAAGIVSTGYIATASSIGAGVATESSTSGFPMIVAVAAREGSGFFTLKRLDTGSNVWLASHSATASTSTMAVGAGVVTLAAELTQLRLTRTGSNTFDNGSANISWRY